MDGLTLLVRVVDELTRLRRLAYLQSDLSILWLPAAPATMPATDLLWNQKMLPAFWAEWHWHTKPVEYQNQ